MVKASISLMTLCILCTLISRSISSLSTADKVIVGVPGHVITERWSTVTPSNHLTEAQQFIQLGKKPGDFVFSYEVFLVCQLTPPAS